MLTVLLPRLKLGCFLLSFRRLFSSSIWQPANPLRLRPPPGHVQMRRVQPSDGGDGHTVARNQAIDKKSVEEPRLSGCFQTPLRLLSLTLLTPLLSRFRLRPLAEDPLPHRAEHRGGSAVAAADVGVRRVRQPPAGSPVVQRRQRVPAGTSWQSTAQQPGLRVGVEGRRGRLQLRRRDGARRRVWRKLHRQSSR